MGGKEDRVAHLHADVPPFERLVRHGVAAAISISPAIAHGQRPSGILYIGRDRAKAAGNPALIEDRGIS